MILPAIGLVPAGNPPGPGRGPRVAQVSRVRARYVGKIVSLVYIGTYERFL